MAEQFEKYIGKYGVLAPIGEGGMGHIYKALDPRIRRIVAIKTVRTAGIHDAKLAEFKERFFREAEISGRLHHPNIVTLYEMDEDAKTGDLFIAMEFIDGSPLSAYTQGRVEMDIKLKLRLLMQAADGLDHAHKQGVVHRDVKPSNILVSKTGDAKITDFGIAKVAESDLPQVTRTDTFLGSPRYSSPEQVRGSGVDARSDIFSFGIMAYEFLIGINPFSGANLSESLYKIAQCLPNLDHANDQVGYPNQALKEIFKRVLHAQQDQRYQTAGSFVRELERYILDGHAEQSHLGQSESQKRAVGNTDGLGKTREMEVVDTHSGSYASLASEDEMKTVIDNGTDYAQPPNRRENAPNLILEGKKQRVLIWGGSVAAITALLVFVGLFFGENHDPKQDQILKNPASTIVADEARENKMTPDMVVESMDDFAIGNPIESRPPLDFGAKTPQEETALLRDRFLFAVNRGDLTSAEGMLDRLHNAGVSVSAEEALLEDVRQSSELDQNRRDVLEKYAGGKQAENLAHMNVALRQYRKLFPEETQLPDVWAKEIRTLEDRFKPPTGRLTEQSGEPKRNRVVSPDQGFLDRIDTPMRQGRFDLAEQTLAAGLDVFADHPEIKWRAGFLAFQKREFDKAAKYFESLVDSENDTAKTISREFFANQAFLQGDFARAKRWYGELSSNLLNMTEQHLNELKTLENEQYLVGSKLFGLTWQDHGIDPTSLDDSRWSNRRKANDIEDLFDENPEWLLSAALLVDFFRLNGQERKAEKVLERLQKQFDSHYYFQETLAAYHYRSGEYSQAIDKLGHIIYPSPRLKYLLGLCYFKLGDKVKARQLLMDLKTEAFPDLADFKANL